MISPVKPKVNVACIGNMNNMLYPIAKILSQKGLPVTLFLLDEYENFIPPNDFIGGDFDMVKLGWNERTFSNTSKEDILGIFKGFNFFIGMDYSAAYMTKAGIRLDIYMPAGSDLFDWPFKKFNSAFPEMWEISKVTCAMAQHQGIKYAKFFSLDSTDTNSENTLLKINIKGVRIPTLPLIYHQNLSLNIEQEEIAFIRKLKTDGCFIIMQQGRQAWKYSDTNPHQKGNDILIKGFGTFLRNSDMANNKLVLFSYGEDVKSTEELINELDLMLNVIWIKPLNVLYVQQILKYAHIIVGNLKIGRLSYGAVYEALACKVSFMGYREDQLYKENYDKLYPMINVATPEEVADQLEYYYHNRKELTTMGEQGHDWLLNYAINPSVQKVLEIIKNHKGRKKLPIDWKLVFMQPYFIFIRIYNVFAIKFKGIVNRA